MAAGVYGLPPSCAVVMKSGNINFLEPSGPLSDCNGTAFTYYWQRSPFNYANKENSNTLTKRATHLPNTGRYKTLFTLFRMIWLSPSTAMTSTANPSTDQHFYVRLRSIILLNWFCAPSPDKQRKGRDTDNSPSRTAEVRNRWSNTSAHPYAFIIWAEITSRLPGLTLRMQWMLLLSFITKWV